MSIAIITGSSGLIGSEAAIFFMEKGFDVVGIDNDMRRYFFGPEASTEWRCKELQQRFPKSFHPHSIDIRDQDAVDQIFETYKADIELVIHAAAQPSHDWAVKEPLVDFHINATGTLHLLEATRQYAPEAVFLFTSTNKVYGDRPNTLPLVEKETRWEIDPAHPYHEGITEEMSIDQSLHSLFGGSKVSADVMVQEYGHYFQMKTACLRGGCLTGPSHAGAQLHGFLAYLMRCAATGTPYTIFGYKGKQVRDNIHSYDLIQMMYHMYQKPPACGEVYNAGGGRFSNCSMLEAIQLCETLTGRRLQWTYSDQNRIGDHMWYISSMKKFKEHFPDWQHTYDVPKILEEIYETNKQRWADQ